MKMSPGNPLKGGKALRTGVFAGMRLIIPTYKGARAERERCWGRKAMKLDKTIPPLIAIVDDEECVREALVSLLRSHGFAAEAFASAAALLASGRLLRIACLILDVRMPEVDGLRLQRVLLGADFAGPIIFITGHAGQVERDAGLRLGAAAFLTKPFSDEALLRAVHDGMARKSNADIGNQVARTLLHSNSHPMNDA
jgi:FixJ family two-component response regulator